MPTLLEQVAAAFRATQVQAATLPADDPVAVNARRCAQLFTNGVDVLRSHIPSPPVRKIARLIWDLIGSRQAATAIWDVPTITFAVTRHAGVDTGMVLIPPRWPVLVEDDWVMQLGAILNAGVQVVDFCNDRLVDERPAALARSLAYEAELLRAIQTCTTTWQPNDYQRALLAKYPEGIRSAGVQLYEPRSTAPKGSA